MPQQPTFAGPYTYAQATLSEHILEIIHAQLASDAVLWLEEKAAALNEPKSNALAVAFAAMPRKVGKALLQVSLDDANQLTALRTGLVLHQWTMDRMCRVWLLLQVDASDKAVYLSRIEQLFPAAEMNELVALYSALPLLAYPEAWCGRCAEGIRSNIGPVLEAIICNNPYPSEQLPQGAWNQLVLKAFFTEKRVDQIIGFDERANPELAHILVDFSRERRAAGRPVPPLLWRGVAPFLTDVNFKDLEQAFYSESSLERDAAALACAQSHSELAKALLSKQPEQKAEVERGALTWNQIAERAAASTA